MITIAICTCNNAEKLIGVLDSLQKLVCPPGLQYEVMVIDNNSRDGTRTAVEQRLASWEGRLRYVFEDKQGLSHARNRALQEAKGDIVSYIDDDVVVDPDWLSAVADAFERHSAAVVGGRSYLIFPSKRPSWLPEHYEFLLSRLDYGDETIVGIEKDLYGLNFSVKKEIAVRVGGFDASLGRSGRSLRSGEESDLLWRVRNLGGVVVYEPRALVGHIVSPERLRRRWFLRRAFAAGVDVQNLRVLHGDDVKLSKAVVHLLQCCGSVVKSVVCGQIRSHLLFGKMLAVTGAVGSLCANSRRLAGAER